MVGGLGIDWDGSVEFWEFIKGSGYKIYERWEGGVDHGNGRRAMLRMCCAER